MQTPRPRDIDRQIVRLAFPAILSNITVPLMGLSDTFISGHLGSATYIAAIAVGTVMVNSVFLLLGFLRMGTTGLTSEAFGRGDSLAGRRVFTAAFLLAIALGAAIIALAYPLQALMRFVMSPPPATGALGVEYFYIIVLSAPASLATMSVTGWMIGRQNTLYPMITSITVNAVNIALSMSLVLWAGIGFKGVAVGTASANWLGLFLSLFLARRLTGRDGLWCPLRDLRHGFDWRRFFRVNTDLLIRSACIMAVSFGMTSFAGRMGDLPLALNAVLMQFFLFFSYFMDGFAFSGEALCGRFSGAGDMAALRLTIRRLAAVCAVVASLFLFVYLFFTPAVASLLTDVRSVVDGVAALKWATCLIPVISVMAFMFDGVYIGLTATRGMLYATLSAMLVFFALNALFAATGRSEARPVDFLWIAFLSFLFIRGIVLILLLPHELRKKNELRKKTNAV